MSTPDMSLHSTAELQLTIGEALGTDYFGLREPFTPQQESYLTRTRAFVDSGGRSCNKRLLGAGRVPIFADREDGPAGHHR